MQTIRNIYTLLLATMCYLCHADANAQNGYNKLSLAFESRRATYESDPTDVTKGLSVSYMRGIHMLKTKPLLMEYGAKMAWTHSVRKEGWLSVSTIKTDFLTLSLPVNLTYKFRLFRGNLDLAPLTGPNFKFNLIGSSRSRADEEGEDLNWSTNYLSRDAYSPANIFQFGWNIGVMLSHGPFSLGYTLTYDFTPYADSLLEGHGKLGGGEIKIACHSLAVGYQF